MKFVAFIILSLSFFQGVPYKPKEEFDIKLDYKFKQRPTADLSSSTNLYETNAERERRTSNDLLPYLILQIKILKLNNESRYRISNNLGIKPSAKKIEEGAIIYLDLGFTADMKDHITPHEYTVVFLSPERSETGRILIQVDEDGSFLVNGEKRGRF